MFERLKRGLRKTTQLLKTDVRDLFKAGEILDEEKLERFEARLIQTDMGVAASGEIVEELRAQHMGRTVDIDAIWKTVQEKLTTLLQGSDAAHWDVNNPLSALQVAENGPTVVLVSGVNGVGKTTSIAKLSNIIKK